MHKIFSLIMLFAVLTTGQAFAKSLSIADIERVKAFKVLVKEVDAKSLNQTIAELERTPHPQLNMQIREAIARAYADIVREKKVDQKKDRVWLYSKVSLNMAYLQFSDDEGSGGAANPLDIFIRQKLKLYLPPDIFHRTGFHYTLG